MISERGGKPGMCSTWNFETKKNIRIDLKPKMKLSEGFLLTLISNRLTSLSTKSSGHWEHFSGFPPPPEKLFRRWGCLSTGCWGEYFKPRDRKRQKDGNILQWAAPYFVSPENIIITVRCRRTKLTGHVARMAILEIHIEFGHRTCKKRSISRPWCKGDDDIPFILKK
jgi:hypothetical protein